MCKEVDNLEKTYSEIESIPNFGRFLLGNKDVTFYYKVEGGVMESEKVLHDKDVSIARTKVTRGAKLDFHKHENSTEVVVLLSGKMTIEFKDGSKTILDRYENIVIEPNKPHKAEAIEDSIFIALTVPNDPGFPK